MEPPVPLEIDVTSPAFRTDPYPFYAALRAAGPINWAGDQIGWLVPGDREITALVRDPRLASEPLTSALYQGMPDEALKAAEPFRRIMDHNMIWQDPPKHTRLRSLMGLTFTPRRIAAMRDDVDSAARLLLDGLKGQAEVDLMETFAFPLPALVIMRMLGLPLEDGPRLKEWSDAGAEFFGNARYTPEPLALATRVGRAFTGLIAYFGEIIAARRREPGADLISAMVSAEHEGDRLTDDELIATCALLLAAGHETSTYAIGNAVLALLRNPDQLNRLRKTPSLLSTAVDELFRYDSPIQFIRRVAMAPIDLGDEVIQPGQVVMLLLGAANRDPAAYEHPDTLDVTRPVRAHSLYFGLGPHFCLGAHLARLEMEVALARLLERYPDLSLASDDLEWNENAIFRGLTRLRVQLAVN